MGVIHQNTDILADWYRAMNICLTRKWDKVHIYLVSVVVVL